MKIAFVSPNYLAMTGGTEIAIHNIAKWMLSAGHDVFVVTRRRHADKPVDVYDGVPVRSYVEYGGKASIIYSTFALYPFLKKHIADVDLIHQFHLLRFGLPVTLFGHKHGKPVLTTLMGTDTYDPEYPNTRFLSPYLCRIMNRSAAMTSPSEALAKYAYFQGCRNDIHIIPHGVNLQKFAKNGMSNRSWDSSDTPRQTILSVGRLHSIKKPDVLIRAMSVLVHSYGVKSASLVMVGGGPEEAPLKELARDLNINRFVEFRGHVAQEDIAKYYHSCDIFAFHSTFETFGIVLVEAMACGKPVVSTTAGAIPEIVNNGQTGILVPPNDHEAFAQALSSLLGSEPAARAMGERGREKAREMYEWGSLCQQYLDLYSSIVRGPCAA